MPYLASCQHTRHQNAQLVRKGCVPGHQSCLTCQAMTPDYQTAVMPDAPWRHKRQRNKRFLAQSHTPSIAPSPSCCPPLAHGRPSFGSGAPFRPRKCAAGPAQAPEPVRRELCTTDTWTWAQACCARTSHAGRKTTPTVALWCTLRPCRMLGVGIGDDT